MSMSRAGGEIHRSSRAPWLRAAVLGADDGVVSTASLMIGVASASASHAQVLLAGLAGLVAGSMSMAAGEFVSVSSQRDAEQADIHLEKRELEEMPREELRELAAIYQRRGLEPELAMQVAVALSHHDTLEAHLRDELGLDPKNLSRPWQAAFSSAASFAVAAVVPVAAMLLAPTAAREVAIVVSSLAALAALGAGGGIVGGAPTRRGALRVMAGGGLAMAVSALVGRLLGGVGL